jgi:hypothetical protein
VRQHVVRIPSRDAAVVARTMGFRRDVAVGRAADTCVMRGSTQPRKATLACVPTGRFRRPRVVHAVRETLTTTHTRDVG